MHSLNGLIDTGDKPLRKPRAINPVAHPRNSVPAKVKAAEPNSVSIGIKPHELPANVDDEESIVVENSPAHFLTKIESFSLFSDYGIDKYETREFEAGDYKWRLIIYPNGKEKGDHISVYLAMAETSYLPMNWEFNAIFTIFLYNQISDKYLCFRLKRGRRFNETKSEWGFPKFMSKRILKNKSNGYLLDDNLVLGAEVYVFKTHSKHNEWLSVKMELYPKGDFSSDDNAVKINLVCVSADTFAIHQKVKAKFCMRIIDRSDAIIHNRE
ncbi:hypothetical protein MIMGU_mgv1a021770mg, partial [Erythranthe guttata]